MFWRNGKEDSVLQAVDPAKARKIARNKRKKDAAKAKRNAADSTEEMTKHLSEEEMGEALGSPNESKEKGQGLDEVSILKLAGLIEPGDSYDSDEALKTSAMYLGAVKSPFARTLLEVCRNPPYPAPKAVIEALGRMFDTGLQYDNVEAVLDYLEYETSSNADSIKTIKTNSLIEEKKCYIPDEENMVVQQKNKGRKKAIQQASSQSTELPSTASEEKPPSKVIGLQPPCIPSGVIPQHPPPSSVAVKAPVKEEVSVVQETTRTSLLENNVSTSFTCESVSTNLSDILAAFLDWITARKDERETIFSQKSKGLENLVNSVFRGSEKLSTDPIISSHLLCIFSILYHPHALLAFAARDYILRIAKDICCLASKVVPSEQGNGKERTIEELSGIVAGPVTNILISVRRYQPPRQSRFTDSGLRCNKENVILSCLVNLEEKYLAMVAAEATVRLRSHLKLRHYANPTALTTSDPSTAGHLTQESVAVLSHLFETLMLKDERTPIESIQCKFRQEGAVIDAELEALRARKKELMVLVDEVNSSIAIAEDKQEALRRRMEEANSENSDQPITPDKDLIADLTAMESELSILFRGSIILLDSKLYPQGSSPFEEYLIAMNQWLSSQADFTTTLNFRVSEEEKRARDIEVEIESYRSLGMDSIVHEQALKAQKLANEINKDRSAAQASKAQVQAWNTSLVELLVSNKDWRACSTLLDAIIAQFIAMDIPTTQVVSITDVSPQTGKLSSST